MNQLKQVLTFILLLIISAATAGAQTGGTFLFTGKIFGQKTGKVYLGYKNSKGIEVLDSSRLQEGVFRFSGTVSEPTPAFFYGRRKSRSTDDPNYTALFLERGKLQANFKINDLKQGKIIGSPAQTDFAELSKQQESLLQKWNDVWMQYWTAIADQNKRAEDNLRNTGIAAYNEELQSLNNRFVREHPQSFVSAWLLQKATPNLDTLKELFTALTPAVQASRDGKELQQFIEVAERLTVGKPAPNFTQPDTTGKPVSVKDFRGKYVLIDFWASWCVPCREESPFLVKAFERYKSKGFTILSVSLDDTKTKAAWLAAIQKDGLTWTHVSDLKAWENTAAAAYDILSKGIPYNFLIDPQGKIAAVSLRGKALEEKLASLLD